LRILGKFQHLCFIIFGFAKNRQPFVINLAVAGCTGTGATTFGDKTLGSVHLDRAPLLLGLFDLGQINRQSGKQQRGGPDTCRGL